MDEDSLKETFDSEEDQLKHGLLHGGFNLHDLPRLPSNVVKLYICANRKEFEKEREILIKEVYPDLKRYCRDNYGVDFHAIDLRWGSRKELDVFQPMFQRELQRCQKDTLGPNILCMLSEDEEVWYPPLEVEKDEYETLLEFLASCGFEEEALFVDRYYKEDKNGPTSYYYLQVDFQQSYSDEWSSTLCLLQQIFLKASEACLQKGLIDTETYMEFKPIGLENEVETGILAIDRKQRERNCILYVKGLLQEGKGSTVDDSSSTCTESTSSNGFLASSLRETVYESMRGSLNLITEPEDDVSNEKKEFSKSFANNVYCSVKEIVDESIRNQNPVQRDPFYREIYNQWNFLKSSQCPFLERDDLMSATKDYFLSETDRPLAIIGENGAGKTSAIAKIIRDVNTAIFNKDLTMRTAIVFRFVGETQIVTTRQFLFNLCLHLVDLMGKERNEIPTDYKQLKYFFSELLLSGEFGGMLIILLDSVDLLEDNHNFEWLPIKIAVNVKLIVSCSSDRKELCTHLLDRCKDSVHFLSPLSSTECERIFRASLSTSWRSVTYEQMSIAKDAFRVCTLPLFLTMAIEEAKRWHSYDNMKFCFIGENVGENIYALFERIEKEHGTLLVSHFLGYLTAANLGLSEAELLDIMSIDEALLDVVTACCKTAIRRMPSYLPVRLLQDLEPFITEREVDGILVLSWKHRQFLEAAAKKYLSEEKFVENVHSNIADYFLGTWGGARSKPYPQNQKSPQKRENEACRFLCEQPNHFGSTEATITYNLRKFRHLPFSLRKSNRLDELKKNVLCDFDYMSDKIKSSTIQELLRDYNDAPDREIQLVEDALKMAKQTIEKDINCLGAELSGRLLEHTKSYKYIRQLVYSCDFNAQRNCPLIPNCQSYNTPGGLLQYNFNAESASNISFHQSPCGIFLTAKTAGSLSLRAWEISKGDPRPEIVMPFGQIYATKDGNFLNVFCNDGTVRIFRSDCGELYDSIEYKYDDIASVCLSKKYLALALQRETGPYLIDVTEASLIHRFSYHSRTMAINSEETYFVCESGRNIFLFELPRLVRKCAGEASDVPKQLVLWGDTKCFVVTKSKQVESITFDITNKHYRRNNLMTDIDIRDMKLSNTGFILVIMTGKSLRLFSTSTEKHKFINNDLPPCCSTYPSSNYTSVSFSADDKLLIGIRGFFVLIWKTDTGKLARVLQTGNAPLLKLLTSSATNKAATLSADNDVQIWDLSNVDYPTRHTDKVFQNPVKKTEVLHGKHQVVCLGSKQEDVKVVNSSSGQIEHILQNDDDVSYVHDFIVSRDGNYVITRIHSQSLRDQPSTDTILYDDLLWDVKSGCKIRHVFDSRFAVFSNNCRTLVFVTCVNLSKNWKNNVYNLETTALDSDFNFLCDFPEKTEFLTTPCVVSEDEFSYIVGVVKTVVSADTESQEEIKTQFLVRGLFSPSATYRMIGIRDIVQTLGEEDTFLDAFPYQECSCLIVYEKREGLNKSKSSSPYPKGAVVYNVEKEERLIHFSSFLEPTTDVSRIKFSSNNKVILDRDGNVFTAESNFTVPSTRSKGLDLRYPCLALKGQHIIGLTKDRTELVVVRVSDGIQNAKIPVHGRGCCLSVDHDDRTIVVGCEDGRVMVWSLILHLSDPMTELISKLPSRMPSQDKVNDNQEADLLQNDIKYIEGRKPPQRSSESNDVRRPPSHQTVSTAVFLTQQTSLGRETPCYVQ
ncbi:NACHT and WD repeat domain-containing protein 2-like [Saccostrea cucullata]|uniref:NACHT and WD repeat domain-containing protein 2-like n=1 Tax=Saccostrea cuccullata TaxID=36930 RepID=UPI002ED60517